MATRKKEDYFKELLEKYQKILYSAIQIDYTLGSAITITNSKILGKKTQLSPLNLNQQQQKVNYEMINNLIKDVNLEVSKKINYLINKNISESGTVKELSKSLKQLFNKNNPNYFNYKNRFKTIATTESTRLLNNSSYNTAQKLKAKKKYLLGVNDNRQGEDSKIALEKYGNPENAIPINDPFIFTYGKKTFNYIFPPNRPNDRELVIYTF